MLKSKNHIGHILFKYIYILISNKKYIYILIYIKYMFYIKYGCLILYLKMANLLPNLKFNVFLETLYN